MSMAVVTSASGTAASSPGAGRRQCGGKSASALMADSKRLRGVTHTPLLDNPDAWTFSDGTLTLALADIADLAEPGSAVRLEDDAVPKNLLIVHGADGNFYVFVNECTHAGRKIDLNDAGELECTSISSSIFRYDGSVDSGPAEDALTTYAVALEGDQLSVTLA